MPGSVTPLSLSVISIVLNDAVSVANGMPNSKYSMKMLSSTNYHVGLNVYNVSFYFFLFYLSISHFHQESLSFEIYIFLNSKLFQTMLRQCEPTITTSTRTMDLAISGHGVVDENMHSIALYRNKVAGIITKFMLFRDIGLVSKNLYYYFF